MDFTLLTASAAFAVSAAVIVLAAISLAICGDKIASNSRFGRLWVGSILLAGTTSLPELVTTVTAVRIDAPGLSWGNILGANMLNMATLAVMLSVFTRQTVFKIHQLEHLSIGFLLIVLTLTAIGFSYFDIQTKVAAISPASCTIIVLFLLYSGLSQKSNSNADMNLLAREQTKVYSALATWAWFVCSGLGILIAAPFLASSAQSISNHTGLSESLLGVLGLALVTTLPELITTATALKIKAYDLGISNMLGTNAINIVILAIADVFYSQGYLFSQINNSNLIASFITVLLTCQMIFCLYGTVRYTQKSFLHANMVIAPILYGITLILITILESSL